MGRRASAASRPRIFNALPSSSRKRPQPARQCATAEVQRTSTVSTTIGPSNSSMPWWGASVRRAAGAGRPGVDWIRLSKLRPMPPRRKDLECAGRSTRISALANVWRRMRVGELVYLYLLQGRAKLQAYMTYNLDSPMTWPEESMTQQVLTDEELIQFHVCVNCLLQRDRALRRLSCCPGRRI